MSSRLAKLQPLALLMSHAANHEHATKRNSALSLGCSLAPASVSEGCVDPCATQRKKCERSFNFQPSTSTLRVLPVFFVHMIFVSFAAGSIWRAHPPPLVRFSRVCVFAADQASRTCPQKGLGLAEQQTHRLESRPRTHNLDSISNPRLGPSWHLRRLYPRTALRGSAGTAVGASVPGA